MNEQIREKLSLSLYPQGEMLLIYNPEAVKRCHNVSMSNLPVSHQISNDALFHGHVIYCVRLHFDESIR